MNRSISGASLVAITAVLGMSACTVAPTVAGTCSRIGSGADVEQLRRLYQQHQQPLVLAGNEVLLCGCGARQLGGDTAGRQVGGDTTGRQLGGDTTGRQLGGDTTGRPVGGDTTGRQLGGDTTGRQVGGDTTGRQLGGDTTGRQVGGDIQARALGGDIAALQCGPAPPCRGYVIHGKSTLRIFDGTSLRDAPNGCVE
jgi:hypothetical protein